MNGKQNLAARAGRWSGAHWKSATLEVARVAATALGGERPGRGAGNRCALAGTRLSEARPRLWIARQRVLEIREAGAVDYARTSRVEDDLVDALVAALRTR